VGFVLFGRVCHSCCLKQRPEEIWESAINILQLETNSWRDSGIGKDTTPPCKKFI